MEDLTIISLFCNCDIQNINLLTINDYKDLNKIKNVKSKYILFYRCSNEYRNVNFNNIVEYMKKNSISLYALRAKYKNNKKLINIGFNDISGIIDREDEIFNLNLDAYIIEKELLNGVCFNEMFEENILINIFEKVDRYYQSNDEIVIKNEDNIKDNASYSNYSNKQWYSSYINNLIEKIDDNHYIKALVLSLYLERIYVNSKQTIINILTENEFNKFIELSKKLLNKIDDDLLSYNKITKNVRISFSNIYFISKLKYNVECRRINNKLYRNDILLSDSETFEISVEVINYIDGYFVFDVRIDSVIYDYFNLEVYFNNKKIEYINTNIYADFLLFGKKIYNDYIIEFKIKSDINGKVEFKINNKNTNVIFKSRLTEKYKNSYWNVENKCLKFKNNIIYIEDRNIVNTFFSEIKYFFSVLIKDRKKSLKSLAIRFLYFITLPYYKKKDIWLTYDKIFKSGDCGEYLYRYIVKKNKYMYYILSPKAKFYDKIKKETNNVIRYGSLKCKLLCLHSKKIFITDSISYTFCSLSNYMALINRNLLNYEVNCIQHGLTMQDIAQRQNRLFDNISNYFIASTYERDNLLEPSYGYSKDQIKLTGIPRFDGLKTKSENIILLAVTWRVDVANNESNDRIRVKNKNFKNTNYYKIFNSIINNSEIIKLLKENNYHMIFLIHPSLITNKNDYETNEFVKIYSPTEINYEDILCKSKVMITDYSGVQYDFAYMNKPLIYFHTDKLPPSYGTGKMDYEKIGFGPIVDSEDKLVCELRKLFEKNFKNDKIYERRVKKFFKYLDNNNCKRIYDEVVGEKNDKKNN